MVDGKTDGWAVDILYIGNDGQRQPDPAGKIEKDGGRFTFIHPALVL